MEENQGQKQLGLGEGYIAEYIILWLVRFWPSIVVGAIFLGLMFFVARRRGKVLRGELVPPASI